MQSRRLVSSCWLINFLAAAVLPQKPHTDCNQSSVSRSSVSPSWMKAVVDTQLHGNERAKEKERQRMNEWLCESWFRWDFDVNCSACWFLPFVCHWSGFTFPLWFSHTVTVVRVQLHTCEAKAAFSQLVTRGTSLCLYSCSFVTV